MNNSAWFWIFLIALATVYGANRSYHFSVEHAKVKGIPSYILQPDIGLGHQTFCIDCKPYETWRP